MTIVMSLTDEEVRIVQSLLKLQMRRISVMKQAKHSIKSHRYELVHGEDADLSPIDGSLAMAFGRQFQPG
jgi:hypothetical protein